MQNLLTKFSNLIFENSCLICNMPSGNLYVCKHCSGSFNERKENHTKYFEKITVYSWGYYDGKLRDGIINLKNGKKKLALYFSQILVNFWESLHVDYAKENLIIIPIPSHKKRIKERGYCQASLIASHFAKSLFYKHSDDLITRIKHTKHMNSLSNIIERKENIQDAFEVNHKSFFQLLPFSSELLIIDDILTSGSTMCEITKAIQKYNPYIKLTGLTIACGDTW